MKLYAVLAFLLCGILYGQQGEIRTGIVEWQGRIVSYEIRGGFAVIEGDILLGTAEEIESLASAQRSGGAAKQDERRDSIVVNFNSNQQRWPDATIYFTIDSNIPNQQRILDAVKHWNEKTRLKVLPRASEPNYVRFRRASADASCAAYIGMRGGEQSIEAPDSCTTGSLIHEIGHAFGLLHEQQRADRNGRVTVLYQNIDKRLVSNFNTGGGTDAAYYDYGSIMHYGSSGFTRDGLTSLETVPVGIPIGQRIGLSAGDVAAIEAIYGFEPPEWTTITSVPEGMPITVDGVEGTTPLRVSWSAGSEHRIAAPFRLGSAPRYELVSWSDGGPAEHSVTARRETPVYSATYQEQLNAATSVASGNGSATLTPASPDGYYPERTLVRIKAEAAPGEAFTRWTGTTNFGANGASVFAPEATLEVTIPNLRYQANFGGSYSHSVETVPAGRTLVVDGVSYVSPVRMSWTPGSTHVVSLNATQSLGNNTVRHEFQTWEDGSANAVRTIVAGEPGTVYRADFKTKHLLTLSTLGTGSVRAEPPASDGFYEAGSTVQLMASPGNGLVLRYWLGDLAGASVDTNIVMDGQKSITAFFAAPIRFRILHSATYMANPVWNQTGTVVTPGEIVTVFGEDIGPATAEGAKVEGGRLVSSLGGVSMTFDGIAAPLVYVSQSQISAVVPYGITANPSVRIRKDGVDLGGLSVSRGSSKPGIYTADSSGKGLIAALNQDGSAHSSANPAAPGSVIVLYATGAGELEEVLADGLVTGARLVRPNLPVWVKVGKLQARVLYAGTAPGLVNGVLQVNVQLPEELLPGEAVPIQLAVGAALSPLGTVIAVR